MKKKFLNKILPANLLFPPPDYKLLAIISVIVVSGLIFLSSASSVISYKNYQGQTYYLLLHQIIYGLIPGLALFYLTFVTDYRNFKKWSLIILSINILLLIAVFIPGIGQSYGRAYSWIELGFFRLQPSELIKLTLTIYLAAWFSIKSKSELQHFQLGFLPFIILIALILGLVAMEPDVGTALIILAIAITIFFVAGGKIFHIMIAGLAGMSGLIVLILIAPYRLNRILVFINPGSDTTGIEFGYQVNQALLAVGSGGWLGRGLGMSIQKFAYLPEVYGDSIFAIIAEEVGFVFSSLLIILFLMLMYRGLKLASQTSDDFAKYLIFGIVTWITFQAFINIGAMVGIAPLTGVPLPFISYGGTSLMALLAAAGILANISRQVKIN